MKGNPAEPGGPLTSKPTWSNTCAVFRHVGFFFACGVKLPPGSQRMIMLQRRHLGAKCRAATRDARLPAGSSVLLGRQLLARPETAAEWRRKRESPSKESETPSSK